jgi:hypothetical protein
MLGLSQMAFGPGQVKFKNVGLYRPPKDVSLGVI